MTGIYADRPGGIGDVTTTAVGMMAAAELEPKTHFADSVEYLAKTAKTFEERRLAVAGFEAAKTFPARLPLLRLDRIYVRNAGAHAPVVLPRRPWSHLSDHAPLVADIEL